jgi:hypothetical protein
MYGGLYAMGKLAVPQGRPTEVLAASVVSDFRVRRFGALTENKPAGQPMRMYYDIDFEVSEPPTEEAWRALETVIMQEMMRFWPGVPPTDDLFTALVLTSGTRPTTLRDGKPGTKAGIHVVFQNMFVDVDMALYMSSAVVAKVQRVWEADAAWATCIDQAVYGRTRGLRWAWQLKCKTCPRCATTAPDGSTLPNRKGCTHCYSGVQPDASSSMYAPTHYVHGDGTRTVLPNCRDAPTVELLLAASIRYVRVTAVSPGFVVYEGAPPRPVLRIVGKKIENTVMAVSDAGEAPKAAKATMVLRGSREARALETAVRRVDRMYRDIDVKYAHRAANGHWYRVFVRNVGASYCLNIGKDHSHAQIVFIVKRSGAQQVCQCKCDTTEGRVTGKRCRDYQSSLKELLSSEVATLFPASDNLDCGGSASGSTSLRGTGGAAGSASTLSRVTVIQRDMEDRTRACVLPASAACFTPEERTLRQTDKYKGMLASGVSFTPQERPLR